MFGSKTLRLASLTAIAGLLALPTFVGEANAAAKAFSSLHVEDFVISDAGGQLDFNTDFDEINVANSALNSSTLTGFAGAVFSDGPSTGDTNALQACVGGGCAGIGENDFSQQPFPPPASFSRGDSRQLGAAITGVPLATQNSVTADTVAGTQLLSNGEQGTAASNVGTDTSVDFSLAEARQVTFSFSARGFLEVRLEDSDPPSSTGSDFEFGITVRDPSGIVFQWNPDGDTNNNIVGGTENADGGNLNQEISRLTDGQDIVDTGLVGFSATTILLDPDVLYTLTISHNSFARAALLVQQIPIPEPGSFALFGLGLVALGLMMTQRPRRNDRMF